MIIYQCPCCPNTEFKELKTIGKINGSGLYRCKCTDCGHIEVIKGKSPFYDGIEDDEDRSKRKKFENLKKDEDLNQQYE